MTLFRLAFLLLAFSSPACLWGQQLRDLKKQATDFMDRALYWDAQRILESYHLEKPNDYEANQLLAEVYMQNNDYQAALKKYTWLGEQRKKKDPTLMFGQANAHHLLGNFSEAARLYKEYLQVTKSDDLRRATVIDGLKRCSVGLRMAFMDDEVVVENMGSAVNSPFHDLMPVESPNYSGTMYFSSGRTSRFIDDFDRRGNLKSSQKTFHFDMMTSQIINGAWSVADPLNTSLNTAEDEFLFDFTKNGQVAIFARPSLKECKVFVDTFNVNTEQQAGVPWNEAIDFGNELPQGVFFFTDSVALFASNQHEGYGGYDLFIATTSNTTGRWGIANLGPGINSKYDEIAPFLAQDGRTLYYSSNGTESMGSFDILRSKYDDSKQDWQRPENMGRPINSGADDIYFRLGVDGSTGFFASNRSGTEGGLDLYSIYYQKPPKEQITRSIPLLFSQVPAYVLFRQSMASDASQNVPIEVAKDEFVMPALYYSGTNQVITPQNSIKLDKIVSFLKTYPHVQLELASYSDQNTVTNFDLYFSLKRAEQVAKYLVDRGIDPKSLKIRGYGGSYPLALNQVNGSPNAAGQWFNRRLDVLVLDPQQLPMVVNNEMPEVSTNMRDPSYEAFVAARSGLNYRVRFAHLDQMFKGDLITKYADPMVEVSDEGGFNYYSGIFASFEQALQHLGKVKKEGYEDAEIVPFLGMSVMEKSEMDRETLDQYQDLKEYLLYIE